MPTTDFRPEIHGFRFPNRFVNDVARLPTGDRIRTSGRCGGMSYAALDIFLTGRRAPDHDWSDSPRGVPPDGTPIADYLSRRQLESFERTSAIRFVSWTLMPSHRHLLFKGVDSWSAEEVPKICAAIDAGRPGVLGLVGADRLSDLGRRNHQTVVFGYEKVTGGVQFDLYDCNTPGVTVRLVWKRGTSGLAASNRKVPWRGFFLHSHDPITPPDAIWDRSTRGGRSRSTGATGGKIAP